MTITIVEKAVDLLGSQVALAKACGVSQPAIHKWISGGVISPENAAAIERATEGRVSRRDLRPNDWQKIWPELVDQSPKDAA